MAGARRPQASDAPDMRAALKSRAKLAPRARCPSGPALRRHVASRRYADLEHDVKGPRREGQLMHVRHAHTHRCHHLIRTRICRGRRLHGVRRLSHVRRLRCVRGMGSVCGVANSVASGVASQIFVDVDRVHRACWAHRPRQIGQLFAEPTADVEDALTMRESAKRQMGPLVRVHRWQRREAREIRAERGGSTHVRLHIGFIAPTRRPGAGTSAIAYPAEGAEGAAGVTAGTGFAAGAAAGTSCAAGAVAGTSFAAGAAVQMNAHVAHVAPQTTAHTTASAASRTAAQPLNLRPPALVGEDDRGFHLLATVGTLSVVGGAQLRREPVCSQQLELALTICNEAEAVPLIKADGALIDCPRANQHWVAILRAEESLQQPRPDALPLILHTGISVPDELDTRGNIPAPRYTALLAPHDGDAVAGQLGEPEVYASARDLAF